MTDVFNSFASKVANKFYDMSKNGSKPLFISSVPKDELWDLYLESIPAQYNPIYRVRRLYDANYDKNFIRSVGRLLTIEDDKLVSVWDIDDDSFFGDVAKKLSLAVKSYGIGSYYATSEYRAGHKPNIDTHDSHILWTHFYVDIPRSYITREVGSVTGSVNSKYSVLKRSLTESSIDSINLILELIDSNSIYRGQEHKSLLDKWVNLIRDYQSSDNKDLFLWEQSLKDLPSFRNSVIGSLVVDIDSGMDIEDAVKSFESKVAPENYKRPTSIITSKMIKDAKDTITSLGYLDSLDRRFAVDSDLPFDQVLFKSQELKSIDIFEDLSKESKKLVQKVDSSKIKEIKMDEFLSDLRNCRLVELLPLNQLKSQQVVITTSVNSDSSSLFKWSNPFAWSYINSDTTDAIKTRVKEMGGNVDADIRVSLSWHTGEDLDLHALESTRGKRGVKGHIFYHNKRSMNGYLDLDMNGIDKSDSDNPVENLIWLKDEDFKTPVNILVDHYSGYNTDPSRYGFDLQVEINGQITTFRYSDKFTRKKYHVLSLCRVDGKVVISNIDSQLELLSETSVSQDKFITVDKIILSPNYWSDNSIGNKHIFFITNDFEIHDDVRGFFNEYLHFSLESHRKVFEVLGRSMKISDNKDTALRGYGFSSTMDNELIVRVTYKNNREQLYKILVK